MVRQENIAAVMGGSAILGCRIRSVGDLEKNISGALPKRALRLTVERVYLSGGDARHWLTTVHPELGQRTPLESAATELGARRVEELLDRLFYGIPA